MAYKPLTEKSEGQADWLRSGIRVFSLIGSMHYKNVHIDNFVQLRGKLEKLEVKGPGSKLRR